MSTSYMMWSLVDQRNTGNLRFGKKGGRANVQQDYHAEKMLDKQERKGMSMPSR